MLEWIFLGCTSTKQQIKHPAQGLNTVTLPVEKNIKKEYRVPLLPTNVDSFSISNFLPVSVFDSGKERFPVKIRENSL